MCRLSEPLYQDATWRLINERRRAVAGAIPQGSPVRTFAGIYIHRWMTKRPGFRRQVRANVFGILVCAVGVRLDVLDPMCVHTSRNYMNANWSSWTSQLEPLRINSLKAQADLVIAIGGSGSKPNRCNLRRVYRKYLKLNDLQASGGFGGCAKSS